MKIIAAIFLTLLLMTCNSNLPVVSLPEMKGSSLLENSNPVTKTIKNNLDGVYKVINGKTNFGDRVVLKWSNSSFSIFSGKNASYQILKGGIIDSTILFEGYWRAATNSKTGLVDLKISYNKGADSLLQNLKPLKISITGHYGFDDQTPNKTYLFCTIILLIITHEISRLLRIVVEDEQQIDYLILKIP